MRIKNWSVQSLGLAQRLILGMMALGFVVISLFSFAMYESTEFMEENLVSDILKDEFSIFVEQIQSGEKITLPSSIRLYGDYPGLEPIPQNLVSELPGYQEIVADGEALFLYKQAVDGRMYALVRDQYDFEQSEKNFKFLIGTCASLTFFIFLSLGYWWIRKKVMEPLKELSAEVRAMSRSFHYRPFAGEISNDEIGELVKSCDSALHRFHEALSREKLFTADISHELRTPITVIQTSAELMMSYPLTDKEKELLKKILKSCQSLSEMLDVFLHLARGESIENKDSNRDKASDILEDVAMNWVKKAESKNLRFNVEVSGVCPGYFSPVLLGTVANNLIKNAVNYTEKGEVTLRELPDGFEVIDTGKGISKDMRENVFKPFVRGTAKVPGIGMGLSIAKRICERAGWTLDLLDSRTGTHFRVRLSKKESLPLDMRA